MLGVFMSRDFNAMRGLLPARMRSAWSHSGPTGVLVVIFLVGLLWLSLARFALVASHWARLDDVERTWRIFAIGMRMDVIVLCQLMTLPATLYLVLPGKIIRERAAVILLTCVA